jgi:hypothetical protein
MSEITLGDVEQQLVRKDCAKASKDWDAVEWLCDFESRRPRLFSLRIPDGGITLLAELLWPVSVAQQEGTTNETDFIAVRGRRNDRERRFGGGALKL